MAWAQIRGCVGCGIEPCIDCKEYVRICDCCEEEVSVIYDTGDVFEEMSGECCPKCIINYVKDHVEEIGRLLWEEMEESTEPYT